VILPLSHLEDTARSFVILATTEKVVHHIYHLPSDSMSMQNLGKLVKSLRSDIEMTWGTSTFQNMPSAASANRFINEFKFAPIHLSDALKQYQSS
jgi:hypothetical protein